MAYLWDCISAIMIWVTYKKKIELQRYVSFCSTEINRHHIYLQDRMIIFFEYQSFGNTISISWYCINVSIILFFEKHCSENTLVSLLRWHFCILLIFLARLWKTYQTIYFSAKILTDSFKDVLHSTQMYFTNPTDSSRRCIDIIDIE